MAASKRLVDKAKEAFVMRDCVLHIRFQRSHSIVIRSK